MSRVQLAINVTDVDEAVRFYTGLFGVRPAKHRDGYANFAIADPPLKLVLIGDGGAPGTLNHLGVEVEDSARVEEAIATFAGHGMDADVEQGVTCCYAVQDKVWVTDPDGARWEVYAVLADADQMACSDDSGCTAAVEAAASPRRASDEAAPTAARSTVCACS